MQLHRAPSKPQQLWPDATFTSKILATLKAYASASANGKPDQIKPSQVLQWAMSRYVYIVLAIGWFFWFLPFPLKRWNQGKPQTSDHRSRWGILLQIIAYALLWQGHLWVRQPSIWRIAACIIFLALAVLLSWTATNALGRHLRFDAAVTPDHELIRTGPYAIIRHPIYASMLAILLGTGAVLTPARLFIPAIVIFLIGTEVRVRTEDNLLATHFGEQFRNYCQQVSAYIPLIR